jgi:hypothetical protein
MCVSVGPTLKTSAGEREHVDEPVGAASDISGAEKGVDLAMADRAGVSKVVLADLEQ